MRSTYINVKHFNFYHNQSMTIFRFITISIKKITKIEFDLKKINDIQCSTISLTDIIDIYPITYII